MLISLYFSTVFINGDQKAKYHKTSWAANCHNPQRMLSEEPSGKQLPCYGRSALTVTLKVFQKDITVGVVIINYSKYIMFLKHVAFSF